MLRTIIGLWKNYEETSENPKYPELKTRYYKKSQKEMMDAVLKTANNKLRDYSIIHVDSERGEILLEKKGLRNSLINITIFRISPLESAIDVRCSKEGSFGDLGTSYNMILTFFSKLHSEVKPEVK